MTNPSGWAVLARSTYKTRVQTVTDYYFADDRGRALGAVVARWEEDYREALPTDDGRWLRAPGAYVVVRVQPMRGGKEFGASQKPKHFPAGTPEATIAKYVASRVEGTRRRYAAKFIPEGLR